MLSVAIAKSQPAYTDAHMPDTLVVLKYTDDMRDRVFFFPSTDIKCTDNSSGKGFTLDCFIEKNLTIGDLKVDMGKLGGCCENNSLIILFEDETKIKLTSYNDFNCKGNAWFKISEKNKEQLATKKIKKVQAMNGRSYESHTQELDVLDQDYFIRLNKMLEKKETYKYTEK